MIHQMAPVGELRPTRDLPEQNESDFLVGVRDYIHVVDLAKGHVEVLKLFKNHVGCKVKLSLPVNMQFGTYVFIRSAHEKLLLPDL